MSVNIKKETNVDKEGLVSRISDIFLTNGLRSTSMDDISSLLKVSKKTLYQLFENKDDVVEHVMIYRYTIMQGELLDALEKRTPMRIIYDMKRHMVMVLNSRIPSNDYDLRKYHAEVAERVQAGMQDFWIMSFCKILDKGIESGDIKGDVDKEIQTYILFSLFKSLRYNDLANGKYNNRQMIKTIIDNFVLIVATPKGYKEYQEYDKK